MSIKMALGAALGSALGIITAVRTLSAGRQQPAESNLSERSSGAPSPARTRTK